MDYRVEDKYLITDAQIEYLKMSLREYMGFDTHAADGTYLIRSLYFDDRFDSCLTDNENGVSQRYKYRVRMYDNDINTIHLEKKSVCKGFVHKDSCSIDISRMNGKQFPQADDDFLYKAFWSDVSLKGFHPVSVVEYERTALVEWVGNVRITFDRNISGCADTERFFDNVMPVRPLFETGTHILEVKYDEILPGYIKRIIDTGNFTKTSYSKYFYSRNNLVL